ncbi:hypothetical protein [Nonomuraea sp. C10]|uniref:hypothetical protein n=1 Tax=Nonomuraea sp. C10 TaxID=2600577 RepID=UPI0011CE9C2D|nr:hypothetical protein [Nonomuraea sp. C10]TXK40635.1 hypothetical protein FR742_14450 [Nonomuraea sp. C10]
MDGFLDTSTSGMTELRVHGVSGTPPGEMLNHPHPLLVAGDGTTGFYRRWWPAGRPETEDADVPGERHREAYAWAGLTSGGRTIALWLLLLPFALANLAYFMLPRPEGGRPVRRALEAAQRLFALLLTGTLVAAVTRASVDLIGWQCTAAGRACAYATAPGWVRWMAELWGAEHSRRLAVTALVPLAVVVVLWVVGRRTWQRDERTAMPPDGFERPGVLLARPRLWHGDEPVRRLRAVHVAFALGWIGLAVAAPFTRSGLGLVLAVANAVVLVAAVLAVVAPGVARRVDPGADDPGGAVLSRVCAALEAAGAAVLAVTLVAAAAGLPGASGSRQLPGVGAGTVQFVLTLGLVAFTLAGTWWLARRDRGTGPRALGGLASWFALLVAAAVANALGLGVMFWTASFFGVPASPGAGGPVGHRLFLDEPVWWTAALVPVLVAGLVVVGLVLWNARRSEAARLTPGLEPHYGRHSEEVAGCWALAGLTDRAGQVLGLLTGIGLAGFALVTVFYQFRLLSPVDGLAGLFATIGSWAMAAFLVGLVLLGRRAYSDPGLRRTIGILWDVSTFWPRATHPLAPPCYTERVVPELISRVRRLARDDADLVLLSGHSQGSVIAASVVLQLDPAARGRVRLLTHGSPLRRLYAAFFPAYFGPAALGAVRDAVPWFNLYRLSDPIGGPVLGRVDPFGPRESLSAVDLFCWDPARPEPGDPLPETRWHAGYWFDPPYAEALRRLTTATLRGG